MRAIDYGIQNFGGISYKNNKSNIIVFNEDIKLDNDSNESLELSTNENSIVYREIEFLNDQQDSFFYVIDGDYFIDQTLDYIKESKIISFEEITLITNNSNISQEQWSYQEKKIYKIEEKYYINNDDSNFSLNDVILTAEGAKPPKKDKPLILLNEDLFNKNMSVIVFISDDGVKLERAYQNIECFQNEVVLFIENDFGSNLFGSVMRIKLGESVMDSSGFPASQTAKIINSFKLNIDIDSVTLSKAIVEEINSNEGLLHFIKKRWWAADKITTIPFKFSFNALEGFFDIISKGAEKGKLDENRWRYYNSDGTKNKDENLLFFDPNDFDKLEEKAKKNAHKKMFSNALKELNNRENQLLHNIKINKKSNAEIKHFNKFLNDSLAKIDDVLKPTKEFLANPEALTISSDRETLIVLNAFLVGLINSIIDVFKGVFDILSLLCQAFVSVRTGTSYVASNITSLLGMFLEGLENILDTIINLFTKENLKAFLEFLLGLQEILFALPTTVVNFILDADLSVQSDAVGYYIGYIIGMFIDVIIGAIATGGVKTVADVVKLITKQFTDLLTLGKKALEKTGKAVVSLLDEIIAIFANIRNGAKNIKPFLDEILEFLRTFFGAISKQLTEFFNKFDVTIQKVPQPVLYSGIPVKVGDDIFALIKEGKEFFRGTKNEVVALAKKLDELGDVAGKKYLDELVETIKKRKTALAKHSSKFDEFFKHFDGEITVKKFSKRNNSPTLWLEGAHNYLVNGKKIVIGKIRKPLGVSIDKIANDIPFIANVEMKYANRYLSKQATSSFFPKNWSQERIMEEVALVYDDLIKAGKNFNNPPFKHKMINSENTFEILIEFDRKGNITNAYPNIKL